MTPAGGSPATGLQARGVGARLGGREVLEGIDVDLPAPAAPGAGAWVAVVGPNGAGKSTLLRVLAGLLPPSHGQVRLDGRALADWPAGPRARRMAWLAQTGAAGEQPTGAATAEETVMLGRLPHLGLTGVPGARDAQAVAAAMAATDCAAQAARPLAALSGGERQRVLLARALATGAPLLLLDEPTTHLDPSHQVALARLFRALARDPASPRTVVTVLHDLPVALHADRLLVMRDGRLRADGAPADPAVQAAVETVFDGALRLVPGDAGAGSAPQAQWRLDP